MSTQEHTFHVHGMHCNACVTLTESELSEHPQVTSAKSNLGTRTVKICGDFGDKSFDEVAKELSGLLSQYTLSAESEKKAVNWSDFKIAVPIALGFIFVFVLLQKLGIVNLVSASKVTYGTAFVVGIIASLSTCMGVVGGLLLSMSATFVHGDPSTSLGASKFKTQILFPLRRIVAFFIF